MLYIVFFFFSFIAGPPKAAVSQRLREHSHTELRLSSHLGGEYARGGVYGRITTLLPVPYRIFVSCLYLSPLLSFAQNPVAAFPCTTLVSYAKQLRM